MEAKKLFILVEGPNDLEFLTDYLVSTWGFQKPPVSAGNTQQIRLTRGRFSVTIQATAQTKEDKAKKNQKQSISHTKTYENRLKSEVTTTSKSTKDASAFDVVNAHSVPEEQKTAGGWGSVKNEHMQEEWTLEVENADSTLIIFDADSANGKHADGGYVARSESIRKTLGAWIKRKNLDADAFDLFLFPDNHRDGNLEDLLLQIIPADKLPAMECVQQYYKCLEEKQKIDPSINTPDHHKVFQVNYPKIFNLGSADPYWDFSSPTLQPLKEFLAKHIPGIIHTQGNEGEGV